MSSQAAALDSEEDGRARRDAIWYNTLMPLRTPFIFFLGWSVVLHAGLLGLVPRPVVKAAQPQRTIEVAYEGHVAVLEDLVPPQDVVPAAPRDNPLEANARALTDFIKKDILKIVDKKQTESPFAEKEKTKKSVSMPSIPGEMLQTPEYRSYYSLVREKIRKYAYFYYRKLEEGEIYLAFSLTPEGRLVGLVIDDSRSTPSDYLKDIARKSVEEAAPYPPFPRKLQSHPELAFNVIIDFELK